MKELQMAYYKTKWEQMCACIILTIIDFGNGIVDNFFFFFILSCVSQIPSISIYDF